jgi:hypothetical protein
MPHVVVLALSVFVLLMYPVHSFASAWILADDYSMSANPNGRWSYGVSLVPGQDFTRFTAAQPQPREIDGGVCAGWVGTSFSGAEYFPLIHKCYGDSGRNALAIGYPPEGPRIVIKQRNGGVYFHPAEGDGGYAVARWTAPASTRYVIWVSFYSADHYQGATTDIMVLKNGSPLAEGSVSGLAGSKMYVSPDRGIWLEAGDVIDIAVGNGGNGYGGDATGVDAVIRTLGVRR